MFAAADGPNPLQHESETAIIASATRGWCLALLALSATAAAAGPENCLTLRDNSAVAQCANQYAPGRVPVYARERPVAAPDARLASARTDDVLVAVPVPSQRPTTAAAPPETFTFSNPEHYRFILNGMAITGIAGFVVLGVVGWLWRLRGASTKRCPFCSARVGANAHVCKSCFRVI